MNIKQVVYPGDLLFYRVWDGSPWMYKVISFVQTWRKEVTPWASYAHVAMVDANPDLQVEATWPRIRKAPIDWSRVDIEIYRVKGATLPQVYKAIQSANKQIGKFYDLGLFFLGAYNFRHAEICTTLVQKAYRDAGINLGEGAGKLLTPNELIIDPLLFKVAQSG
jgi:uncharacterized protein YycO